MNKSETAKFLALVQSLDGRSVEAIDVEAWHLILADIDPPEAAAALVEHHKTSRYPVRPADIYQRARPAKAPYSFWDRRKTDD